MKLVIGLGNPGSEYQQTRHNVGFMAIDNLVKHYGYEKNYQDFQSEVFVSRINNEKIIFAKPLTYMNLSGQSVAQLMRYYKVAPEDLLIIHDEKDFPSSRLQLKPSGSAAGHNGVKSIIQYLKTDNFKRLRIGIGSPRDPQNLARYVLKPLSNQDKLILEQNLNRIKPFLREWIQNQNFEFIMNRYNPIFGKNLNKGN